MTNGFNNNSKRGAFTTKTPSADISAKVTDKASARYIRLQESERIQAAYDKGSGKLEGMPNSYKGTTYDPSQTDQEDGYQSL